MHELKDYGTICDLDLDPNLVGLVAPHQVRLGSRGLHPLHTALCRKSNVNEMNCAALGPMVSPGFSINGTEYVASNLSGQQQRCYARACRLPRLSCGVDGGTHDNLTRIDDSRARLKGLHPCCRQEAAGRSARPSLPGSWT